MTSPQHIAIVGAGMSAITCARTLVQAGHRVTIFEKSRGVGGRMSTRNSPFGTFDHGAQYFTVRDPRFALALQTTPDVCKPWSATSIRVMDPYGRVLAAGTPKPEAHWVPAPGMNALLRAWAQPLQDAQSILLQTRVTQIQRNAQHDAPWQITTADSEGKEHVYGGFHQVVLAMPAPQTDALLRTTPEGADLRHQMAQVSIDPCWTMMIAFPNAMQPGLTTLGPQWNVARSSHHRIAWLVRESSKPGRNAIERWTVQANATWSQEHLQDDEQRVQGKLLKAFAEITGIRAQPSHVQLHRWLYAQTRTPLDQSHLLDRKNGIGICGDWCLGQRVENAFVSGLELALAMA